MLELQLVIGAVLCAFLALRASRLLLSALWLAGASALVSILLYLLGAVQVAVIELSVGAGLVTVLFVFAIGIAGEEAMEARALVPPPLAAGLVILAMVLLAWLNLPLLGLQSPPQAQSTFGAAMWQQRGLDVLVQVVLIFSGVLGALGLLAERVRAGQALRQRVPPVLSQTAQSLPPSEVRP